MVSKVPYVNRLFRNVSIGRATTDRWIPRDAATVVGRSIADKQRSFEPLVAEEPTWKEEVRVECAVAGDVADHSGSMTRKGDMLHYVHLNMEEVETPWPVLGQLPVLGSTFTSTEIVLSEEAREVPLESVLSVVEPAPGERLERVGVDFD